MNLHLSLRLVIQISSVLVLFVDAGLTSAEQLSDPLPFQKDSLPVKGSLSDDLKLDATESESAGGGLTILGEPNSAVNISLASLTPSSEERKTDLNLHEAGPQTDKGIQMPSIVQKPSGNLYIDSVHSIPASSLYTGGIPACDIGQDEEKEDLHELSSSRFGFPKSIVNKALDDSPFKYVLNTMASQQYHSNSRHPASNQKSDWRDVLQHSQPLKSSKSFGNSRKDKNAFDSNLVINSEDNFYTEVTVEGGNSLDAQPEFSSNFNAYQENDGQSLMSDFGPPLLEGSSFGPPGNIENSKEKERQDENETSKKSNSSAMPTLTESKNQEDSQQYKGNAFNTNVPIVNEGISWQLQSSDKDLEGFKDLGKDKTFSLQDKRFPGIIENLFPPKKAEKLPVISGIKDIIPTDNPVIKYSDDKQSGIGSPFEINFKSLFGNVPSSNPGLATEYRGPKVSSDFSSSSSSNDKFGFVFGDTNFRPADQVNGGGFPASNGGFPSRLRRRKRKSGSRPQPRVSETCQPTYELLQQYKNHGGACFVVLPEAQRISFAKCPQGSCSGCRVRGGSSRCAAVQVATWVWSYCESGPHAGRVMQDRVSLTVACTCRVAHCHPVPLGSGL